MEEQKNTSFFVRDCGGLGIFKNELKMKLFMRI